MVKLDVLYHDTTEQTIMTNEKLYEEAHAALNRVFGDRSVSLDRTIENLESLSGEIDALIDAAQADQEEEVDDDDGDWNEE